MALIDRMVALWQQPLSRKLQYLSFKRDRLVTLLLHRPRLRACGRNSIVQRPLFWTPENISLGSNVLIWPDCRIEAVETGNQSPQIFIGDQVTLQQSCHITAGGELRIGEGTTILFGVMITDIDHRYDCLGESPSVQPIRISETRIGSNCFIGAGAMIFPGTRLGDHCVVGANSVVRGVFPDRSVIVGAPGRIVKYYDPAVRRWIKSSVLTPTSPDYQL